MQSLFRNRYADALAKTILFFGAVHLIVLGIAAVRVDVFVLNAFKILNLDLFMPDLGAGVLNLLLSYGVVLLVFCLAYKFLTEPRGRGDGTDSERRALSPLEHRRAPNRVWSAMRRRNGGTPADWHQEASKAPDSLRAK